jgi:cardiolipin synthase
MAAAIIFSLASISDFLDGYFARKFHVSSELGAMLDPLADKTLMAVSYVIMARVNFIPTYAAIFVVGRDFLILSVVLICKILDVDLKMRPTMSSKINTTIQLIFVILVLACNCLSINVPYIIKLGAAIVCVSTVFSGVEYVQKYYWIKDELFKR